MPKSASLWLLAGLSLASCSLVFDTASSPAIDAAALPVDASLADAAVPGTPFPPEGRTIRLVDGIVGDVNGDDNADIVLANAPGDGASDGFFVLFGPQTGPNLEFHHFVASAVPPTAIGLGPGALGEGSGHSTVFVAGRETSGGSIEAFVYDKESLDFTAADKQTTSSGSDPSAIMPGTYNHEGAKNDLIVSAGRGVSKFFDWLPTPGGQAPYATGETFGDGLPPEDWTILDLGLVEGQTDDELLIVFTGPRVLWRFFSEPNAPLSSGAAVDGDCGKLVLARVAQKVDSSDSLLDIVALSDSTLCAYRLRYDGARSIQEFPVPLALSALPAARNGFDDILAADLGGEMAPEIVVLDTDNLAQTLVHFLLDATPFGGDIVAASLTSTGVASATLDDDIVPSFLLALDFDHDGLQQEVWAFDSQGNGFACLVLVEGNPMPCW